MDLGIDVCPNKKIIRNPIALGKLTSQMDLHYDTSESMIDGFGWKSKRIGLEVAAVNCDVIAVLFDFLADVLSQQFEGSDGRSGCLQGK